MDTTQKQTLKAALLADTTMLEFSDGSATIASKLAPEIGEDDAHVIVSWCNQLASPDFFIWRDIPIQTVLGLITFANMTPQDAVPSSNLLDALLIWQARSLACQGKQLNLQNMIIGRTIAPMKNQSYRTALNDCLTALPSGVDGVDKAAGWAAVRDAAKFLASNAEKVFAVGSGEFSSPADASFEGAIALQDIYDMLAI